MSRPLRLEFPGALYHLTSRGDRREPIFEDDTDRAELLNVVALGLDRFDAGCFAYCLMGNHYHFVIQTRSGDLSRLVRHINGVYTQSYNRRHGKVGHLFQGRFKAVLVDEDAYFLEVCRYVDLNPVRARMVRRPHDWTWSSFRAHAGLSGAPSWLNSAELHWRIAPRAPHKDGPARYAEFVAQGHGVPLWETALTGQIYLGGEAFVQKMQQKMTPSALRGNAPRDVPRVQRLLPPPIDRFLNGDRDVGIVAAYRRGGYTQTAIAAATGLSVSRVSRLIAAHEPDVD